MAVMWIILVILGGAVAKKELGELPDYYPKVNPNPNNIEDLNIKEIDMYFDMFNKFHEIHYKNDEERNQSFTKFKDNVKRIIIMNKFSRAAKFAINEFSHITLDQFVNKYTGFNDSDMDDDDDISLFNYTSTQGAPVNLDWRSLGLPSLVKHQGPCKSSYVFSAIANIEAQISKNFNKTVRLSEQQAYDCEPSGTCFYGGMPHKVMETIKDMGGIEEHASYINDPKDRRECKANETLMVVKVTSILRLKPVSETSLVALLALYGPIVITMHVSESVKNYHKGVLWPTDCDKNPNHAVLLVGYGVTEDSIPYWIIKNSWGMLWGETGYIRLVRGENACNIGTYVVTAIAEPIEKDNTEALSHLTNFKNNISVALNAQIQTKLATESDDESSHKRVSNNPSKTTTTMTQNEEKNDNEEATETQPGDDKKIQLKGLKQKKRKIISNVQPEVDKSSELSKSNEKNAMKLREKSTNQDKVIEMASRSVESENTAIEIVAEEKGDDEKTILSDEDDFHMFKEGEKYDRANPNPALGKVEMATDIKITKALEK